MTARGQRTVDARPERPSGPVAYHAPVPPIPGRSDEAGAPDELQRALALVVGLRAEVHELIELLATDEAATKQRGLGALLGGAGDATAADDPPRPSRSRALGKLTADEPAPPAGDR